MTALPGWYPDPSGQPGFRYWDGSSWHASVPRTAADERTGRGTVIGFGIFLVVVAVAGVIGLALIAGRDHAVTGPAAERSAIDTCQGSVRKQLKDPDSARFSGWTATETGSAPSTSDLEYTAGDQTYVVLGAANAKNGFGGYNGDEMYSCVAVVHKDGTTTARAHRIGSDDGN